MIFPLHTDRRLRRTPWVNITLIAVNAVIFLIMANVGGRLDPWIEPLVLHSTQPRLHQFVTYQFLHGGWSHIAFNMLFLYVFGNSLEDRFGKVGYLFFYLAGGICAGLGHVLTSDSPVIGASGAVSAVTGAFLALFPRSYVTILYVIGIIGTVTVQSIWIILFYIGMDMVLAALDLGGNVARLAHLSGNLYGFVVGMGLLVTILPREPYDFMALIDRWRRRREMKALVREGYSPWQKDLGENLRRRPDAPELDPRSQQIARLRREVTHALAAHQPQRALDAFERLLQHDPRQVLPRQQQLDLANFAMTDGRHHTAVRAYETFTRKFPSDEYTPEVMLILGLIYLRYLDLPDRARPCLEQAVRRLADPDRRQMAQDMLDELPPPTPAP